MPTAAKEVFATPTRWARAGDTGGWWTDRWGDGCCTCVARSPSRRASRRGRAGWTEEASQSCWARAFRAVCSRSFSPYACSCAVWNSTAKPDTDGVIHPPVCISTVSLMWVTKHWSKGCRKNICPVMVKKKKAFWLRVWMAFYPISLTTVLQTGKRCVVIVFPYQINHGAFIRKPFCVSCKVPNWLSSVFMTHILNKHLLILIPSSLDLSDTICKYQ